MKDQNYRTLLLTLPFVLILLTVFGANARSGESRLAPFGCSDNWDTSFTSNGANDQVNVIVPDGSGNYYVGGKFSSVQGVPAPGIAKWNGSSWSALGAGINGIIYAIAVSGNDVYVGGDFNVAVTGGMARNVAKWDGSTWTPLGTGLGGGTHIVRAAAVYGGNVYFGGNFAVSGGSPADGLVKWDGTAYSALPIAAAGIRSLVVNDGSLYVGGNVALTPGPSIGIVKFDGTTWSDMGPLANTIINSITFSGSDMYVGGSRIVLAGQQDSHVARFDGTSWTRMAFFSNGLINAVEVHGGELYAGGYIPSSTFNNLAKWNGSNWGGVGSGIGGGSSITQSVTALASIGDTLYVGGNFTSAGGQGARNIAKITAGTWSAFSGTGLDNSANAIAVSGNDVYVGGSFITAGPLTANRIAKWNSVTNTWSSLGVGITGSGTDNSFISAIAVAGGRVYAGGSFPRIGGVTASNIAVWNGTAWAPLGTGITGGNGRASVIIVRGEDVYVGGDFATAGGVPANRVAKWNGTSWSGLNSTIIPTAVTSMAFMGDDLYVGTGTTTAANPAYFSKYDGTNWTALGADLGDRGVSSIAVIGSDVYVGGGFITVSGETVNRIVRWNGSSWSALGGGLPPASFAINGPKLAVSGDHLIASGDFTTAAGGPGERIAKWNGTTWTNMGAGLNANANALLTAGGDIFAGGSFTTAGCNQSPYFARWRETVWTGSTNTDWHTSTNWGGGSVPASNSSISIVSSDSAIVSADVTVSDLIIANERTLTIGSGRSLTVSGNLDLNGTITGPGTLIVNGGLQLNGNIAGLASLVVNGDIYLGNGIISAEVPVSVTSCRANAIAGGSTASHISGPLTRCVNGSGMFRFPVGVGGVYAPIEVSGISGSGTLGVTARSGQYPGAAVGLPVNRLARYWDLANNGITEANFFIRYLDQEVVGIEGRYRGYTIDSGAAQLVPTVLDFVANTATITGATAFSAITLAEGPANFETLKGRIRTPTNRGADRVLVSLTDGSGNVRFAMSNNVGYYRFLGVETWKNYTVRVISKKYSFAEPERTLEFVDNAPDVNFVSTDH